MLALAEALEDAGYAYATPEGNVYYDVGRFEGYGQLSGNTLADLRAGHRGDIEPDKRDPADFALWKAAGDGRILKWPTTRWGEGFPGWHLECSAMAMRYLGPRFDIHTGGIDNVFPHHEDEIAQSTPISGEIPARHWVHGEFLLMDGRKMAKSAGNFQRVTELVERGLDPLAFRYLVLTSRYSRKLEYSDRSIAAAAAALESLRAGLRALGPPPADGPWAAPRALRAGSRRRSTGGRRDGGRRARRASRGELRGRRPGRRARRSPVDRRAARSTSDSWRPSTTTWTCRSPWRCCARSCERRPRRRRAALAHPRCRRGARARSRSRLGRRPSLPSETRRPAEVTALVEARTAARAARDWARADALRAELEALGWDVTDTPDGPS